MAGGTDEGAEGPAELDADECVDEKPCIEEFFVATVLDDEWGVAAPENELRGDAGGREHEGVEEDGGGVIRAGGVANQSERREGEEDERERRL